MKVEKKVSSCHARSVRPLFGIGAACLAALAGSVEAGDPANCAAIADNTERLACYDDAVGRPHQEAPPQPVVANSLFSDRWELDAEDKKGSFLIRPYRPTYILLGRWSNSPNRQPTSANPANTVSERMDVDPVEAKYQISFKTKLWKACSVATATCGSATPSNPTGRCTTSVFRRPSAKRITSRS